MLSSTLVADCDQCGRRADQLTVCSCPDDYREALRILVTLLEADGWHIFHEHYRCPDCLLNDLAARVDNLPRKNVAL